MTEIATMTTRISPAENMLDPFFAPKGIAVIGAGTKPGNQGKRIVDSLIAQGFSGQLFAVHPDGKSLGSCPSVRSVQELPPDIDLAIAAVSAERVEALVKPLADQGIHHLIVVSGGFSESGPEGELLQKKLKDTADKLKARIIGPNCIGTFSSADKFNSFFLSSDDVRLPGTGSVAVISQSGAFLSAILDQLASRCSGRNRHRRPVLDPGRRPSEGRLCQQRHRPDHALTDAVAGQRGLASRSQFLSASMERNSAGEDASKRAGMERLKGLEPSTSTLARLRSTTELQPLIGEEEDSVAGAGCKSEGQFAGLGPGVGPGRAARMEAARRSRLACIFAGKGGWGGAVPWCPPGWLGLRRDARSW